MHAGIEALTFYCPHFYLDLKVLAQQRNVPYEKYHRGIGQERMAITGPDEDVVTMAANAAAAALRGIDVRTLDSIIFATESGVDQSKSAAIYVHQLLGLPAGCKAFEVKQACCGSTMALQMALGQVALRPDRKTLIVASDIARYGFGTSGEPTQGAGAIAMVISAQPRLLVIDPESGSFTEDVMDFWRPNYLDQAIVDGKFSMKMYLKALTYSWQEYKAESGRQFSDLDRFAYHLPFTRMAEKAHAHLAKLEQVDNLSVAEVEERLRDSLHFSRLVGNCYTASLYVSLLSLLENSRDDLTGKRIGLFSYGSGCVGSFFSGVVPPGYEDHLHRVEHYRLLTERTELSWPQYLAFYQHEMPTDGSQFWNPVSRTGGYRLAGVDGHRRLYAPVPANPVSQMVSNTAPPATNKLTAIGD